jgi:hypothetical protein
MKQVTKLVFGTGVAYTRGGAQFISYNFETHYIAFISEPNV